MKRYFLKFSFFCALLCLTNQAEAQVTIGSNTEPNVGAILDLKDNTTSANPLTNAKKGLGMPRVNLTNINDITADISGVTAANKDAHIGLIVYNTNECLTKKGHEKGLYTWDGSKWQYLYTNNPSPEVQYFLDNRTNPVLGPQTYPYRTFGNAGTWMLENLRHIDPSMTPNKGNFVLTDRFYTYPNRDPNAPGTAPSTWSIEQGLLYTYPAATLGTQNAVTVDQGQNNTATPSGNEVEIIGPNGPDSRGYKFVQGICPNGWHIPSDREWNALEKELYNNAAKYSSYSAAELPFTAVFDPPINTVTGWDSRWETGYIANQAPTDIGGWYYRGSTGSGGHSFVILAPCNVPGSSFDNSLGKSLLVQQGGFYGLLTGNSTDGNTHYGQGFHVWTSSVQGPIRAWRRGFVRNDPKALRGYELRYLMYPVRCKMN